MSVAKLILAVVSLLIGLGLFLVEAASLTYTLVKDKVAAAVHDATVQAKTEAQLRAIEEENVRTQGVLQKMQAEQDQLRETQLLRESQLRLDLRKKQVQEARSAQSSKAHPTVLKPTARSLQTELGVPRIGFSGGGLTFVLPPLPSENEVPDVFRQWFKRYRTAMTDEELAEIRRFSTESDIQDFVYDLGKKWDEQEVDARLDYADEHFGLESDMGRVYAQLGQPSRIDRRSTTLEVWHYDNYGPLTFKDNGDGRFQLRQTRGRRNQ